MAMLNFIQDKSYTKISGINWDTGRVGSVRLETYDKKPDWTYAQAMEEPPEGDDEAAHNWREETAESLAFTEITYDKLKKLNLDLSKNIWSQVYTHLHSLSMFGAATSDEA